MPETVVHFQVRMPPVVHERMASRAQAEKRSLNAVIVAILNEAIAKREGAKTEASAARSV
jgi:predicted HicB family RNase H-like nuclease